MERRVVITGLGVIAPNACTTASFTAALKEGRSGIRFEPELERLGFSCRIAGRPEPDQQLIESCFDPLELRNFNSSGILYGVLSGMEAWKDAGLSIPAPDAGPDWDSGAIFGNGASGSEKFRESIYRIDEGQTRRLGSTAVVQTMVSGISAWLGGKLGLGNQVSTNASACTTGAESIWMCFERIRSGRAERMLAGSTSDSGPYIWGGFDAMKVCTFRHNDDPQAGSRPMSASAAGFVPGSGAGALVLESLDSALQRGARIYAELAGGHINSGGQRGNGSMTAPNEIAVQRCIREALADARIPASAIDAINGHLTATTKDALEIKNWSDALGRKGADFPFVYAMKSLTGHCLSASGSIECVASVLQLYHGLLFPNRNCEDLHPEIAAIADPSSIPQQLQHRELYAVAKASFGFGDVNACLIFKRFDH